MTETVFFMRGPSRKTAVTYGNRFANGYLERDWTGVGVSLKFDFFIIHESGHEWFGYSITASDVSDAWIHEGWGTYLECVYVEHMFGYADAVKYVNGYKSKVRNREPIITRRGINRTPPQDMYFKGALFIHTLRSVIDDDSKWWLLLRDFYRHFRYQNIWTEDGVDFFSRRTGKSLAPLFDQYLRHEALPTLELRFPEEGRGAYRWAADVKEFAMPVRVGRKDRWHVIRPTTEWQTMATALKTEGAHIMAAFSRDLVHWMAHPEPLYKAGGHPGGLDSQYAHKIALVRNPATDTLYLYYCAVGNKGRCIGLLTSARAIGSPKAAALLNSIAPCTSSFGTLNNP